MAKQSKKQELGSDMLAEMVDDFLTGQSTFKDVQGFTDDEMEAVYTSAFNLYAHGKYQDAKNVFSILCQFDHYEPKYWIGLAAARHMLKDYLNAAQAYGMSLMFDDSNPIPLFHCADCLIHLDMKKEAMETLEHVIKETKDSKDEALKNIHAQSKALLKGLKGGKGKKGGETKKSAKKK